MHLHLVIHINRLRILKLILICVFNSYHSKKQHLNLFKFAMVYVCRKHRHTPHRYMCDLFHHGPISRACSGGAFS